MILYIIEYISDQTAVYLIHVIMLAVPESLSNHWRALLSEHYL